MAQEYLGHANSKTTLDEYAHLMPGSDELARKVIEEDWSETAPSSALLGRRVT
jgi:hypothetical protein